MMVEIFNFLLAYEYKLKQCHWGFDDYALHLLTDRLIEGIGEYEDKLMEVYVGLPDVRGSAEFLKLINGYEKLSGGALELKEDAGGDDVDVLMIVERIIELNEELYSACAGMVGEDMGLDNLLNTLMQDLRQHRYLLNGYLAGLGG